MLLPITTSRLSGNLIKVGGTVEDIEAPQFGIALLHTTTFNLPSTVSSSVMVSLETTPLIATQVYVPLSERDTLEIRRTEEEVLPLEPPSVMVT